MYKKRDARASRFLYISLPSLHDYDVKMNLNLLFCFMFLLQCCYFANHCTCCFVLCSCCHRLHRILPDVREKEDSLKVCLNLDIYTGQNLDLNLAVKMALAMASASVV